MISTEDSIIRLIMALILGGLIGYERQAKSKSAGLRTHTLVCVGSCLCMIISINIAMDYYFTFGYNNSDPERIAAQVVSGVGFIGAVDEKVHGGLRYKLSHLRIRQRRCGGGKLGDESIHRAHQLGGCGLDNLYAHAWKPFWVV